jgi:hypothetical protein
MTPSGLRLRIAGAKVSVVPDGTTLAKSFICQSVPRCQSTVSASAYAVVDQAQDRCIEAIRSRTGQDDHNQHDRV